MIDLEPALVPSTGDQHYQCGKNSCWFCYYTNREKQTKPDYNFIRKNYYQIRKNRELQKLIDKTLCGN